MGQTIMLCFLPAFVVVLAHNMPGYSVDDMAIRPHLKKIEKIDYQMECMREIEARQIKEIEELKVILSYQWRPMNTESHSKKRKQRP